ncbi:uncharacterized protein [Periplaneta americana]|uniref:uncharacterized protein isoform X2 n=1 Tax=Periplaneta americana TaxID=6978 RepID=UPI0037E897F3
MKTMEALHLDRHGRENHDRSSHSDQQNLYVEPVLIVLTQASIQIMESSISEGGLGTTDKKLAASMGPIPAPSFEKEEENEEVSMFGLSVVKEEDKRRAKDGCCPCLKNVFEIQFMNYEAEEELRVEKEEKKKETKAEEKNRKKNWLFNDAVSTTTLFSVNEIGDSEMRPRIRHRSPGIHLTFGENLGKNPTRSQHRQHQAFFNSLCWRIRAKETIS